MEYVKIGKIINTHGIKGDLKIDSYTDFEAERFKKNSKVYFGDEHLEMTVNNYRIHQGFILANFKDYEDINQVLKFKNMFVYKSSDDIKPLKNGEYYFKDLRDLDVYVEDKLVGKVLNVEEGLRNNNLRILKDSKEVLVPYLPQFIKNVDLKQKRIDIIKMEGLL